MSSIQSSRLVGHFVEAVQQEYQSRRCEEPLPKLSWPLKLKILEL